MQGTVSKVKCGTGPGTGYGFIKLDTQRNDERDLFFHKSTLRGLEFNERLTEQRVECEIEVGSDSRDRAKNVRPIGNGL